MAGIVNATRFAAPHSWSVSIPEALALQEGLRGEVDRMDRVRPIREVAGIDVGYEPGSVACACVAVLDYPGLALRAASIARRTVTFPYVPGLLSFREAPAILEALEGLDDLPDLLLCDGHGLAHPRRFGLACHIGLLTGVPTIGVAKRRLVGEHSPVPDQRGAWAPLEDQGETVGAALRTRVGARPIYVSIGHRISLPSAIEWVMNCTGRCRLPETTRWAHRLAGQGWRA